MVNTTESPHGVVLTQAVTSARAAQLKLTLGGALGLRLIVLLK